MRKGWRNDSAWVQYRDRVLKERVEKERENLRAAWQIKRAEFEASIFLKQIALQETQKKEPKSVMDQIKEALSL